MTDLKEQIAVNLWHRFAPEGHMEWSEERHAAEYRDAAEAVLFLARGCKKSEADSLRSGITDAAQPVGLREAAKRVVEASGEPGLEEAIRDMDLILMRQDAAAHNGSSAGSRRDEIAAGAFYKTRGDKNNLPHIVGPLEHADDGDAPWQARVYDQVWKWGYDGLANADGSPHNRDLVERVYRPAPVLNEPQAARESDFEQAFRDACDEVGCEYNNETLLSSIANLTSSPRAFAAIAAERQRQISAEGWTLEHDDSHISGEMAMAAAVYALTSFLDTEHSRNTAFTRYWPWDRSWFKPAGGRRDLVRAAALIVAEIERLDRASSAVTRPHLGCK